MLLLLFGHLTLIKNSVMTHESWVFIVCQILWLKCEYFGRPIYYKHHIMCELVIQKKKDEKKGRRNDKNKRQSLICKVFYKYICNLSFIVNFCYKIIFHIFANLYLLPCSRALQKKIDSPVLSFINPSLTVRCFKLRTRVRIT